MNKLFTALILCFWLTDAFAQNFEIYVSDAGNFNNPPWQILKFDQNGENPEVFTTQNLGWPQDILFLEESSTVLISNLNTDRINRHNASTGDFIEVFASNLDGPTRMKIGPDGLLYVLQWNGNGRVKRYELDGTFVDEFTSAGVPRAIGLDWDDAGNLYVSSFNVAEVRKFDEQGNDLGVFASANLQGPTNIWFGEDGSLFVSDWRGGAIRRYDASGEYVGDFITGLSQSEGVDSLPNGNLLIGNGGTAAVKMYDSNGNFLEDFIESAAGGLIQPNAIRVRESSDESTSFQINAGLNDAWFNPATSGQGFSIVVYPEIEIMFVSWFTFDTERPMDAEANLGDPGQRWLTAQGPFDGNRANLSLFVTRDGVFDAPEPTVETVEAGTLTIEFADCTEALVSYQIESLGVSGQIPIQRISPDNVGLCESLQPN